MAILSLCIFNAFCIRFLIQAKISHCPLYLLFPCSCSAYQTSFSAYPGSSTGYVYTMAVEHSLLVYRLAVEHSLLVYRMAVEHSLLRRRRSGTSVAWRQCELTCGYHFPMHIQCVSHSIFYSGQHFTLSSSTYSSHAAVVPTRLLIAHPPAPAPGTYTRWRWSILFWYTGWRWSILYWYTGWRWSILYWYTGWRWSILYSGDVGEEHRSLERV